MSNPHWRKPPTEPAPATGHTAPLATSLPEKTGPRPGLPGPAQPSDYDAGCEKVNVYIDSDGV